MKYPKTPLNINKIMIVCLDNLGDTVMATACLPPLKHLFPEAQLGIWVKKYAAPVLVHHPLVNCLYASDPFWDSSPGQPKGSFGLFMKTLNEITEEQYDAALVLNTEWRRSLACLWAKIPQRIGYKRRHASPFLTHGVPEADPRNHFVDIHKQLISAWVKQPPVEELYFPSLHASESDLKEAAAWKFPKAVVLHPFTGDERKCWPLASWFQLVKLFRKIRKEIPFILIGGKNDEVALRPFRSEIQDEKIQLLLGAPLPLIKGLLAGAAAFVGGDSGPGHMAAALNTPLVSLFGDDNPPPRRCGPRGKGLIRIVRTNSLTTLPPEAVAKELDQLLTR